LTEAEKQVALKASLSASELVPTKKEAPDGGLKGVEVLLYERAAILFKQLALGRLKHLFARGKVTPEQSVELRCHPLRSVRIWERWLNIKAEFAGVTFEVPARLAHLPDLSQPNTRTFVYDYVPPALGRWRVLGR
jgi:hypothetical protein